MNSNESTSFHILLVEDSEHDWLAFRRVLQKSGVPGQITRYARAEEALERLKSDASSFDLVVADYKLPGISGLALCRELLDREIPLPLVLMTGVGTEHLAVKAIKAGVDDYIVKDPEGSYLELLPVVLPDVVRRYDDRLARRRAEEALRRRNRELALLNRLSWELTVTLDSQRVIRQLLQGATEIVGAEGASVWLVVEEPERALVCQALFHRGQHRSTIDLRLRPDQGIAGWMVQHGESIIVSHAPGDPRFFPGIDELTGFCTASLLGVPLQVRGQVIGVLEVVNKLAGDYDSDDLSLVEMLAAPAAIAIENARLYEEAQQEIAERVRAEEELKQHRDHLEELVKERTTELVVAKEQAEAAQSAAEAANRAKSAFLASVSHELRTPLNAILGYAQILQRRPLEADVIDNLRTVQQSGEHLLTLINDILTISKIETGRLELHPAQIHFPNLLEHIAGIIRARAEAKGLTFTFDTSPISPEGGLEGGLPTWVEADETRLRQVLLNLLDNAVKFTEAGQVTLRVAGRQQQSEQGSQGAEEQRGDFSPAPLPPCPPAHPPRLPPTVYCLRFEVEDTGIGISLDHLKRIFQPFEQAEDVTRWTQGAGLGLPISRQLVRLMGGELQVESPPFTSPLRSPQAATEGRTEGGPGSLFWFEVALPVMEVAVEVAPPPKRVITGYRGTRRTVLVVDDVPSNRAVLVDLLEPLGFDVVEAADGRQAIHLAQKLRPDLILMDRWMPVLDGFEATQQMRQIPELAGVTIVAISASVSAEDQAQSRKVGINAFRPKPVNWPNLAALLEEHLELEWEYQEPGSQGAGEPGREYSPAPLVPPPGEEMEVLHNLALRGDMRGIRERAAHIETLGEQYAPFARKLLELAKGFEERQLLILIKQYMEEAP